MKRAYFFTIILALACSTQLFADDDKSTFPQVNWTSTGSGDQVTVNNGSGVPILIVINVSGTSASLFGGINITNCGNTTHVTGGSTVICSNNDPNNPVSFSAEGDNKPVSGTYQIKPITRP